MVILYRLFYSLLCFLLLLFYCFEWYIWHGFPTAILSIIGINLIVFFSGLRLYKLSLNFLLSIFIFVLGYCIVNFQSFLDNTLGFSNELSTSVYNTVMENKSVAISCTGFVAFCGGVLWNPRQKTKSKIESDMHPNSIYPLSIIHIGLLFITFLYIFANRDIFHGIQYSQEQLENTSVFAQYTDIFFQTFCYLYMALTVYNIRTIGKKISFFEYIKSFGIIPNACVAIYLLSKLMFGDRGSIIYMSMAYFSSLLLVTNFKFKIRYFLAFIIASSFIMTQIVMYRNTDSSMSFNERIKESFEAEYRNTSILPLTSELAKSSSCLRYAVEHVPEKESFAYGLFIFKELVGMIPWGNRVLSLFGDSHFRFKSSSYYCTWLQQGESYEYGNGSSCTADLYLNFGFCGVVIGMFIFGQYLSALVKRVYLTNCPIGIIVFYIVTSAYAIYIPRATLLCYWNYIGFTLIFYWGYCKLYLNRVKHCSCKEVKRIYQQ